MKKCVQISLWLLDDEDLRHLYVDALKTKGFKVQSYSNTREALDEIRDDPRKYRLVISDVMMKQMNGPIFANKIKEINRGDTDFRIRL